MQFKNELDKDGVEVDGLNEIQKFLKEFPLSSGPPKLNLYVKPETPKKIIPPTDFASEVECENEVKNRANLKWDKDLSDEKVSSKEENDEYEDGNILDQSRNEDRHSLIKSNRPSDSLKMSKSCQSETGKISSRKIPQDGMQAAKKLTQSTSNHEQEMISQTNSEERVKSKSKLSGIELRYSLNHIRKPMVDSMTQQRQVLLSPDQNIINESNFNTITELSFVESNKKRFPLGNHAELTPSEIKYEFKRPNNNKVEEIGEDDRLAEEAAQLKDKTHMLNIPAGNTAGMTSGKTNKGSKNSKSFKKDSSMKCQEFNCVGPDFLIKIDKVQSDIRLLDDKTAENQQNGGGLKIFSPDRFQGKSSLMRGEGGLLIESFDQYFFDDKDYSNILLDIMKLKKEVPINLKNLEASQRLNKNKLKEYVDNYHARDDDGEEYSLKEACLNNYTGAHYFCKSSNKKNEIKKFGIGISLYFKFLKYLSFWFVLFFCLSIPMLMVYIMEYSEVKKGFRDQLFSATIGTFGLTSRICKSKKIVTDESYNIKSLSLQCKNGVIDEQTYNFGITLEDSPCLDSASNYIEQLCFDQDLISQRLKDCSGQAQCELQFFDLLDLNNQNCQEAYKKSAFFKINLLCRDSYVEYGGKGNFQKRDAIQMASSLDCIISIGFFIMILILKYSEKNAKKNLLKEFVSVSDFTIMLSNLPDKTTKDELSFELLKFLNEMITKYDLSDLNEFQPMKIIDIKLSESSQLLEALETRRRLKIKKDGLIRRFFLFIGDKACLPDAYFLRDMFDLFKELKDGKQKVSKILHEIVLITGKIEKLEEKIEEFKKSTSKSKFKFAWVTFETTKQKKIVYEFLRNSNCNHFVRCSCMGRDPYIRFKNKKLKCTLPTDPLNIAWSNINTSLKERLMRYLFNFTITCLTLFIYMYMIFAIKESGRTFLSTYGQADCNSSEFSSISEAQVISDYEQSLKAGYIKCFCSGIGVGSTVFTLSNGRKLSICEQYLSDLRQFNMRPMYVAFLVLILNTISVSFIKKINNFERNHKTSVDLISKTIKLAFIQTFTMIGLYIMIFSKYTGNSIFLLSFQNTFQGQFTDMNTSWYKEVGVVLMTNLLINIVSVPFLVICRATLRVLKRRMIKGCRFSLEKQTNVANLKHIFIGPEFEIYYSYSNVLVAVGVSIAFGSVMPLLYVFTLLQIGVVYWTDKLLFFKLYRLPKFLNGDIQNFIRRILYFILAFRLILSIWNFGNDEFQGKNDFGITYLSSYLTGIGRQGAFFKEFQERASKPQTQFQLFLLTLFILFLIAKAISYIFIERIVFLTKKYLGNPLEWLKNRNRGRKRERLINFFEVISKEKLNSKKELLMTLMNSVNGNYKDVLVSELAMIEHEIDKEPLTRVDGPKLLGLASYDIRDNPDYNINYVVESKRSILPHPQPQPDRFPLTAPENR